MSWLYRSLFCYKHITSGQANCRQFKERAAAGVIAGAGEKQTSPSFPSCNNEQGGAEREREVIYFR